MTYPDREYKDLALELLSPHPANRKHFDPKKLEELTASVKDNGVITPLLVQVGGDESGKHEHAYRIIAGERRWRAAKAAGLKTVPCFIRDLTEDEALELLLTENLQREDPHPIEEADTYAAWLERPGHDVRMLAARLGMSVAHVYSRLQLRHLSELARETVWAGKLPISHALLLARIPAKQQDAALKKLEGESWRGMPTLNAFMRMTTSAGEVLEEAPFDREDATLCPAAGSCSACPKRLHFKDGMFPELAAALAKSADVDDLDCDTHQDRCLDSACWDEKVSEHVGRAVAAARSTHGDDLVLLSARFGETWPKKETQPLPRGVWEKVTKKTPGAVPGILIKTDNMMPSLKAGELLWVKVKGKAKAGAKAPTASAPAAPSYEEQQKARAERIEREVPRRRALADAIFAKLPAKLDIPFLVDVLLDELNDWQVREAAKAFKIKLPAKLSAKMKPIEVMQAVVLSLAHNDLTEHMCGAEGSAPGNLLALAHHFGLDGKKVLAAFDAKAKAGKAA